MRMTTTETCDVVVVGARSAGAATAMLLAAAGHDVQLVDRASFPSDTLSTHAIGLNGMVQLDRWGLLPKLLEAGTPPIRNLSFRVGEDVIVRSIKERFGVDMLMAPRRHVLDTLLVDAAVAAGAKLRTGVTIDGVLRSDMGRVAGVHGQNRHGARLEIEAAVVVGADGRGSRIARAVDAPFTEVRQANHSATYYAYFSGHWPTMKYYLGDRTFAGVFPTNHGEACIWVCLPADKADRIRRRHLTLDGAFDAMLRDASPELAERIKTSATRRSVTRGATRLPNHLREPVGPGWALVGDAGYHRDPITGQGISDAFRDADLLATALDGVLRGDVDEAIAFTEYHQLRDLMLREVFEITCELVTFPSAARFVELQKQLSAAIEAQAAVLASRTQLVQVAA